MPKPVKFTTKPPKSPKAPKFDTSFDFGFNAPKKGTGKKKKAPVGGGS